MTKPVQSLPKSQADSAAVSALAPRGAVSAGGYPTVAPRVQSECPPINNMGENEAGHVEEQAVLRGRRTFYTMAKVKAHKRLAIIDWLNFTVHEDTFNKVKGEQMIDTDHYVIEASKQLEKIFGFGVTMKRDMGMNFYRESWIVGEKFGHVCFGGQRETMLISISGLGCQNAASGWEKRLYDFLNNFAVRPSISRIDLAHDDLEGRYLSVDWAASKWAARGFNSGKGGRLVNIERVGNWDAPTGAGRTVTFGIRSAGKFCRFYEKGRQLGDKNSSWCRAEVEFKSSDRIIPLDVLLEPSAYFAGAYPCFAEFFDQEHAARLQLKEKTARTTLATAVRVFKHQFGKYQSFFRALHGDAAWLEMSCSDDRDAVPKRLEAVMSGFGKAVSYIHEGFNQSVVNPDTDYILALDGTRHVEKKHIQAAHYWVI